MGLRGLDWTAIVRQALSEEQWLFDLGLKRCQGQIWGTNQCQRGAKVTSWGRHGRCNGRASCRQSDPVAAAKNAGSRQGCRGRLTWGKPAASLAGCGLRCQGAEREAAMASLGCGAWVEGERSGSRVVPLRCGRSNGSGPAHRRRPSMAMKGQHQHPRTLIVSFVACAADSSAQRERDGGGSREAGSPIFGLLAVGRHLGGGPRPFHPAVKPGQGGAVAVAVAG